MSTGGVTKKAGKLVCWQCGGSLHEVRKPIRHGARCPRCRADLHVCRQCRHYAPKSRGECDHERADRVADKASANYCTHFRPARGAFHEEADIGRDRTRDELSDLFGLSRDAPPSAAGSPEASVENARRELDALFGLAPESGAEPTPPASHDADC